MQTSEVLIWIFFVLVLFIFIGLIIYQYVKTRKGIDIKIPPNANKVMNYIGKNAEGYSEGVEIDYQVGKKGRVLCTFIPTDIDTESEEEIKPINLVVGKNKRIVIPKGTESKRRNKVIYLPNRAEDIEYLNIPEAYKKILQDVTIKINKANNIFDMLEIGDIAQSLLINKFAKGEYTKNALGSEKEMLVEVGKALKELEGVANKQ